MDMTGYFGECKLSLFAEAETDKKKTFLILYLLVHATTCHSYNRKSNRRSESGKCDQSDNSMQAN